jgi:alpha-tubulin suppressor-like RCC1 family protein
MRTVCAASPRLMLVCLAAWLAGCSQQSTSPDAVAALGSALTTSIAASGDTYVTSGVANRNHGGETIFRVQSLGKNRGVLFFDPLAIRRAVSNRSLMSASLRVTIDDVGSNWGNAGRPIAVHRLKQASAEYAATWNCALDANIDNLAADCSGATAWTMNASASSAQPWISPATDTHVMTSNATGVISFDVTADVTAILAGSWPGHGWLLKNIDEGASGTVSFRSREQSGGPELVLEVQGEPPTDSGVSDAGLQSSVIPITADTHVRQGVPNQNFGTDTILRLQAAGRNRALANFDAQALRTALGERRKLHRAQIQLAISRTFDSWGPDRAIGAHRLRAGWSELGATWNCAIDGQPNNFSADCSGANAWAMWNPDLPREELAFVDPPLGTANINDDQTGLVTLDVSVEVACQLAGFSPFNGFLIKKEAEYQSGRIEFASRETATPPVLLIEHGLEGGLVVNASICNGTADGGVPDGGIDAGTCTPRAAIDTTCDGVDDDCDGVRDDDYTVAETQCGEGSCRASGELSCINGVVRNSCVPLTAAASDTSCDGRDDDCNGRVDDGYVAQVTSCGAGGCAAHGMRTCVAGIEQDSCSPLAPANDDDCDNGDDDCDGLLDEAYPFTCLPECQPLELVASLRSNPPSAQPGALTLGAARALSIPLRLHVVTGNAGSGSARLQFEVADGPLVDCTYRGDATGAAYALEACSNGALPGDRVQALALHMNITSANPNAAETIVRVQVDTCGDGFGLQERLDFPAFGPDEFALNPLLGVETGRTHLLTMWRPGSSWSDIRDALAPVRGHIVSAAPDIGYATVTLDGVESFVQLAAAVDALRESPNVYGVSYDFLLTSSNVPRHRTDFPPTAPGGSSPTYGRRPYDWMHNPGEWQTGTFSSGQDPRTVVGGNWGARYVRAPVAWNLLPALTRAGAARAPISVAILDGTTFTKHADLAVPDASNALYAQWPASLPILSIGSGEWRDGLCDTAGCAHGTFIASIIASEWGNGKYVDGLAPFTRLRAMTPESGDQIFKPIPVGRVFQAAIGTVAATDLDLRAINMSVGVQAAWGCCVQGSTPGSCQAGPVPAGDFTLLGCDVRAPEEGGWPAQSELTLEGHNITRLRDCDRSGEADLDAVTARYRREMDEAGIAFSQAISLRNDTRALLNGAGLQVPELLVVAAAGNDGDSQTLGCDIIGQAHWMSPMANAALRWAAGRRDADRNGIPDVSGEAPAILVAEALEFDPGASTRVRRATYSNVTRTDRTVSSAAPNSLRADASNVSLFAPGDTQAGVSSCDADESQPDCSNDGTSTVEDAAGTSFATPHVVGAVSFLASVCPGLNNADLQTLLFPTGSFPSIGAAAAGHATARHPVTGPVTSTRRVVDFANALRLISEQSESWQRTRRCMLGAPDPQHPAGSGNLPNLKRAFADLSDGTTDGFQRVVLDAARQLAGTLPNQAPPRGQPDGKVDMRDMRAFRDLFLMSSHASDLGWGEEAERVNPRRDVNGNGVAWHSDPRTSRDCRGGAPSCVNDCSSDSGCPAPCGSSGSDPLTCTECSVVCTPHYLDAVPASSGNPLRPWVEPYSRGLFATPRTAVDAALSDFPKVSLADLAILQDVYVPGPGIADTWAADKLPDLLESADLVIRSGDFYAQLCSTNPAGEFSLRVSGKPTELATERVVEIYPLPADVPEFIITTPNRFQIMIEVVDATGVEPYARFKDTHFDHVGGPLASHQFDLEPGEDRLIHLNPDCAIRQDIKGSAGPSKLALYAGAYGDVAPPPDLRSVTCAPNACLLFVGGGTGGSGGTGGGGAGGAGGSGGTGGGGATCGNARCDFFDSACPEECGPSCFNFNCDPQDADTCPWECGVVVCGDGRCEPPIEDAVSCALDCGSGSGGTGGGTGGSGGAGSGGGTGPCGDQPVTVDQGPYHPNSPCCVCGFECPNGDRSGCPGTAGSGGGGAGGSGGSGGNGGMGGSGDCEPTASRDVTCDGEDDDCDGSADEDFAASPSTCGRGVCAARGTKTCANGAVQDSCQPGEPVASDGSCDGIDQDCDGKADQDYTPRQEQCGCETVTTSCESGAVNEHCPVRPTDATCDGNDDDCDGALDEDFRGSTFSCGCGGSGSVSCIDGHKVETCSGGSCPRTGGGTGDPHMTTFDGLAYEFQQVGEYIYSSDGGDFVLQVRTAPYYGSSTVASNHAVAAHIAGDRVGYYYDSSEPLLVNSQPAAVPAGGLTLAHGGRVVRTTKGYELRWPSGEVVTIGIYGLLNVTVTIPDREKAYVGLLGTWDGDPRNDLVPRGGQPLQWPISSEAVYGAFGDSWRITQQESLFDYGPGQDTTTFTDELFPSHVLTANTLGTEDFNQAHDACVAAGVDDETQLDGCILDVAATGGDERAAIATAEAALPPPVAKVTFNGYYQNFEAQDDGRWSTTARYAMPAMDVLAPTTTLGLVSGGQTIVLTIPNLPAHDDVSVAFETHVIGPWAGDSFEAAADAVRFVTTSFSNTTAAQKFPGQQTDIDRSPQSGALAVGTLDAQPKAVYHHSYTFEHSASSLTISFVAPQLPQGASFAIDNVAVVTGVVGDPWNPKCVPGGPSLDDGNPCTLDQCDPAVGAVHTPRTNGTPCGDGNLCNGEETCNAFGECRGTPLVVGDGNPCTADSCDPLLGVIHDPLSAGTACADTNHCNGAETCDGLGTCTAGAPPDPATLPPDTTCNGVDDDCNGVADEDFLEAPSSCGVGACVAEGSLICFGGAVRDTCQPLFPSPNDSLCDAIDADCNGNVDEDYVATCVTGGASSCVAGQVGVTSCDDGDACTSDACAAGACTHAARSCDDGNTCTADSCDHALGCSSVILSGFSCEDGSLCTIDDVCDASGTCVSGRPAQTDDAIACTADACSPATGISHTPNDALCDDANACTLNTCSPVLGCTFPHAPEGTPCTLPNSNAAQCAGGVCEVLTCGAANGDCDGVPENGCETNLNVSRAHCGNCNTACTPSQNCAQGACVPALEVGLSEFNTCALTSDGRVQCWGANRAGALGDGTNADVPAPTPVYVLDVADAARIDTGQTLASFPQGYSCVVRTNGHVACWGFNGSGQLGDGTTTLRSRPVEVVGMSDAVDISVGRGIACAVRANGHVMCWGNNFAGGLGNGTLDNSSVPVEVKNLVDAVAVSVNDTPCALRRTGQLACWGFNRDGEAGDGTTASRTTPVFPSTPNDVVAVATGLNRTCVVHTDRTVSCWGLGIGTTPVKVAGLNGVVGVAMSEGNNRAYTCAVLATGGVKCWGDNDFGQLGNGTTTPSAAPVDVLGINNAVRIYSGNGHTCAVLQSGHLACWGRNTHGQLGDGTITNRSTAKVALLQIPSPCTGAECAPQIGSISVDGRANAWAAGLTTPPGGGMLPPMITLAHGGGAIVTFQNVTGTVTHGTAFANLPPDGVAGAWTAPDGASIAGYTHATLMRGMVGVFLASITPLSPLPPRLSFADGNFTSLSPVIGQMFFIGDGRTAAGDLQQFRVPLGATRLAIGGTDLCSGGTIGCFDDNTGAWQTNFTVTRAAP